MKDEIGSLDELHDVRITVDGKMIMHATITTKLETEEEQIFFFEETLSMLKDKTPSLTQEEIEKVFG